MRSVLITGDRSGSGKTSITLAISAILAREYNVQPFKVAMDYIDPSYLTGVTGRMCRNLDSFVMNPDEISDSFTHACEGADIAVIEGVRGLYEGSESLADTGSTASIAKMLNVNVILVIDARSITRSAAAIVMGFMAFDPKVRIKGVILNQVISEKHTRKAKEAIESATGIPVIGAIPRKEEMKLTMRHLGLIPYMEGRTKDEFTEKLKAVTDIVEEHVDMDALLSLTNDVEIEKPEKTVFQEVRSPDMKIGIALDEAFNFYYNDLFDILKGLNAEPVFFSPVHDRLPEAEGYIFGGGYPELFAGELEGNSAMREAVREVSANGTPIYAECGGLIYLTEKVVLKAGWSSLNEDESYSMAGVFKGKTEMPVGRVVSYVEGVSSGGPLGKGSFKGHEFHHTDVTLDSDTRYSYLLSRGKGIKGNMDGALVNNTLASYTHLHPAASYDMISNFVRVCRNLRD
ncbi:Ni-sirohydrochlorin a,c-diamide synthase [Methanoplanus endosymbiosus]|uniref:Cobyrinate a,c-diamide synthase n=1 Tax=Methanoplanus endosymbiosus TaxID=33865 RepID=A0A9E7TL96_9EURY|nr:Ni-sirohydrochlorin a,c-diamide synthase [Methanoplanus endosymbiosus]UUX92086.1 Ni-sirohydrochlorin a,c-diamide synthase [Methanoplanus endosymbiosus]